MNSVRDQTTKMKNKDVSDHVEYKDVNQLSYHQLLLYYNATFSYLPWGALILDGKGHFVNTNSAYLQMFAITKHEAEIYLNSPAKYFRFYDLDSRELPFNEWPIRKIMNKNHFHEERYIIELTVRSKPLYVSCTGLPQVDEQGNYVSGLLLFNDISGKVPVQFEHENEILKRNSYLHELDFIEQRIKGAEDLLRAIIDTIPVMVTIYDSNVNYIILNKAVEKITGWTQDDVQKTSIMELAFPDVEGRKKVLQFMISLEPGFRDFVMLTKDGRKIETSWANVKVSDGRHVGVGIDISGRKKMEQQLMEAKNKAEKENLVQYAFIQNISHEVRTPMNSILGFAELLKKTIRGEQEQQFLDAISISGRQLLRLINDIIDFSRLDKKEMSLTMELISLTEMMKQLKGMIPGLKNTYSKRQLKTNVNIPAVKAKEIFLNTDIYRLQQVFINLISNALKYSDKGKVDIGYKIIRESDKILFYVKDTGIGIKPEDHERVFERFNRLHNNSKKQIRGTGLGLAICKHLVTLLGGDIWFESKPGEGSVFYFTHPMADQPRSGKFSKVNDTDQEHHKIPDLSGYTILVAEDDVFSYKMIYYILNETKAKILHAEDGAKALRILKSRKVHFCFLDLRLPEMSGFQVLNWIRTSNLSMPVVALTANALPEDKEKTLRAGFDYHATKPIAQNELYNLLNRFINRNKFLNDR